MEEDLPTPFELASLAVAVRAYMGPSLADDQALEEALRSHRLAQAKLKAKREQAKLEEDLRWEKCGFELTRLHDIRANQPRLKFAPTKETDEVRDFLEERPDDGSNPLPNLRKGTTVKQKLCDFFVDCALLLGETAKDGEQKFLDWLGQPVVTEDGVETYGLPQSDLCRFRHWRRELPRLEALWRKRRKDEPHISALEFQKRLIAAASGQVKTEEHEKHLEEELARGGEEQSKKIISELRSVKFRLTVTNQRTP